MASVLKILQDLLELQSVDVRLNEVRGRLAAFPKKITDLDARIAAAKAELEKSKAAQLATVKDRKKYELDVEQYKERVRKYKDQTAQIKTNEAYKALQHEVQMAEEEIAKAEDRLLEQMVASEEYDRLIKASEKRLKEVEESVRGQRATIESEKAVAEKDLAVVEADRARVKTEIPEDHVRSLRTHREKARRRCACRSERRKMHALRHANPPSRVSKNAQLRQSRNVSLRDVHSHPLLHRADGRAAGRRSQATRFRRLCVRLLFR